MSDTSLAVEILSDLEKEKISQFCGDEILVNAVRKVILAGIYSMGVMTPGEAHDPTKNFALTQAFQASMQNVPITNEELGQSLRAKAEGIRLLEIGFGELDKIQPPKPEGESKKKTNRGM